MSLKFAKTTRNVVPVNLDSFGCFEKKFFFRYFQIFSTFFGNFSKKIFFFTKTNRNVVLKKDSFLFREQNFFRYFQIFRTFLQVRTGS